MKKYYWWDDSWHCSLCWRPFEEKSEEEREREEAEEDDEGCMALQCLCQKSLEVTITGAALFCILKNGADNYETRLREEDEAEAEEEEARRRVLALPQAPHHTAVVARPIPPAPCNPLPLAPSPDAPNRRPMPPVPPSRLRSMPQQTPLHPVPLRAAM
mmetsp:Transcript_79149/g.173552  ORF Transcript_79149/g.173552 Transcript_79149/m.173552 type:complete len:158 (+) Transcript_79149:406-879(+)